MAIANLSEAPHRQGSPRRPDGINWKAVDALARQGSFVPKDWSSVPNLPQPVVAEEISLAAKAAVPMEAETSIVPDSSTGKHPSTLAARRRVARVKGEKGRVVRRDVFGSAKLVATEDMPIADAVKLRLKQKVVVKGDVEELDSVRRQRRHAVRKGEQYLPMTGAM
jgi:hypothetical protein